MTSIVVTHVDVGVFLFVAGTYLLGSFVGGMFGYRAGLWRE